LKSEEDLIMTAEILKQAQSLDRACELLCAIAERGEPPSAFDLIMLRLYANELNRWTEEQIAALLANVKAEDDNAPDDQQPVPTAPPGSPCPF
jgi:hypothetical protein